MSFWQLIFFISCALICFFCFFTRVKMAANSGKKNALLLAVFRFAGLTISFYLIWQIFWDKNLQQKKETPVDPSSKTLVALVDVSGSMDLKSVNSESRKTLSREILKSLKKEAETARQKINIKTLFFSKNLYEPEQKDLIEPEFSVINESVIKTVQREDLNSLLLISDGAATDPPISSFSKQWINNRGLKMYSTLSDLSSSKAFDVFVKPVNFDPVKADKIPFQCSVLGVPDKEVKLKFEIDGKLVKEFKTKISRLTDLYFKVPEDLKKGWHKYSIYCEPLKGDISSENNLINGAFKRKEKRKILYLTGRPRREDISIIRFLKMKYPERREHISIYNPDFLKIKPDEIKFLIAANIPYNSVPGRMLENYFENNMGILLLAGDNLASWSMKKGFSFNVILCL